MSDKLATEPRVLMNCKVPLGELSVTLVPGGELAQRVAMVVHGLLVIGNSNRYFE